jgi:hypothetical protein
MHVAAEAVRVKSKLYVNIGNPVSDVGRSMGTNPAAYPEYVRVK